MRWRAGGHGNSSAVEQWGSTGSPVASHLHLLCNWTGATGIFIAYFPAISIRISCRLTTTAAVAPAAMLITTTR